MTPQAGATGNVSAATPTGSGTSWVSAISGPGAVGAFLLAMEATDSVGHIGTASKLFNIQTIPPALAGVGTNANTYSEVSGFTRLP